MGAGAGSAQTWASADGNPSAVPFGGTRFDGYMPETVAAIPTAGVFSGLAVQTGGAYAANATFTVINGQGTGDTGGGSGDIPTSGGSSQTPGFNNTSLAATATAASGWFYDATDIAAFTSQQLYLLQAYSAYGTGAVNLVSAALNFTAPAHLGLLTQGAG